MVTKQGQTVRPPDAQAKVVKELARGAPLRYWGGRGTLTAPESGRIQGAVERPGTL